MYLRTTRRTNKDGTTATYYQLAHNERNPDTGHTTARVIHNFGRDRDLDRDVLVRLCQSIARVANLEVVDPLADPAGSAHHEQLRLPATSDCLPEGLTQHLTCPLGVTWVLDALWERLGIQSALHTRASLGGVRQHYERALFAMVANRLSDPTSKLGVWDRWLQRSYVPGCDGLELRQMYEAMDLLHRRCAEVEEAVFFHVADLMNLVVDVVFFDTTTASFCIDEPDVDDDGEKGLRAMGHAKEGGWTPQVVVALAVTREGLPIRSWILPGNQSDMSAVERVRKDLRGWKLGRALFVADAGMNSAENRERLVTGGGTYILACRAGSVAEIKKEVLSRPGRYKEIRENLHAKEVVVGEGEKRRRYIVCFNPSQKERQAMHREGVLAELEARLAQHKNRSATAKWTAELRASRRYGRYLRVDKGGQLHIDKAAIATAARMDGKWVLITNDDTLSIEDVAQGYQGLMVIERCFRTLKTTQIKLRPMYHWLPRRIETHVKLCVLALLLERYAEVQLGRPWAWIKHELDTLQVTEFRSDAHRFFRRNTVTPEVADMLKKLQISVPKVILGVRPLPPEA